VLIGSSGLFFCVVGAWVFLGSQHIWLLDIYENAPMIFGQIRRRFSIDTKEMLAFFVGWLGFMLVNTLLFLVQILLTLCILNATHIQRFRFIIGLFIFIGLNAGLGIICGVFMFILDVMKLLFESQFFYLLNDDWPFLSLIMSSLLGVSVFYFIARYLIIRRLELI